MMNSGKADAQNSQKAVQQDANFTQEKAADTTIALIKPSEPSGPSAVNVGCSTDNEVCNCKPTATPISTLTTDASEEQEQGALHLDFKCFYCSQVCPSNNDRVQHIDNEHPGKLYYPTPEDFQDRLSR